MILSSEDMDFENCIELGSNALSRTFLNSQREGVSTSVLKVCNPESTLTSSEVSKQLTSSYSLCRHLTHPRFSRPRSIASHRGAPIVIYPYHDSSRWRPLTHGLFHKDPISILVKICEVLDYIHLMGVVHRDVKLENFLVDRNLEIILIDHDFAFAEGNEADALVCGTPAFSAPEISGAIHIDRSLDMYSLGSSILVSIEEDTKSEARLTEDVRATILAFIEKLREPDPGKRPRLLLESLRDCGMISQDELVEKLKSSLNWFCLSQFRKFYQRYKDSEKAIGALLSSSGNIIGLPGDILEAIVSNSTSLSEQRRALLWLKSCKLSRTPNHWNVQCGIPDIDSYWRPLILVSVRSRRDDSLVKAQPVSREVREFYKDATLSPSRTIARLNCYEHEHLNEASRIDQYLLSVAKYRSFLSLGWHTETKATLEAIQEHDWLTLRQRTRWLWLELQQVMSSGDYQKARTLARDGYRQANPLELKRRVLQFGLARAWLMGLRGKTSQARALTSKFLKLAKSDSDYKMVHRAQYDLAVLLYRCGSGAESEELLKKNYRPVRNRFFGDLLSSYRIMLGIRAYETGAYSRALRTSRKVMHSVGTIHSSRASSARLTCSISLIRLGRYAEAKVELERYLMSSNRESQVHVQIIYYWTMGWLHHNQGFHDQAGIHYSAALELSKRVYGENNPKTTGKLHANIAHLHLQTNNVEGFWDQVGLARKDLNRAGDKVALAELAAYECMYCTLYEDHDSTLALQTNTRVLIGFESVYAAAESLIVLLVSEEGTENSVNIASGWVKNLSSDDVSECPLFYAVDALLSFHKRIDRTSSCRDYRDLQRAHAKLTITGASFLATLVCKYISIITFQDKNIVAAIGYAGQVRLTSQELNNNALAEELDQQEELMNSNELLTKHYSLICELLVADPNSSSDLDQLMKEVLLLTGAECGAIVLERLDGASYYLPSYLHINSEMLSDVKLMSLSIAKSSSIAQQPFVVDDAMNSELTKGYASVMKYNILSVASYPFITETGRKGALYLAHHSIKKYFQNVSMEFLAALARIIGLVISLRRERKSPVSKEISAPSMRNDHGFVYADPVMHTLMKELQLFASTEIPIMIVGEPGVGKELIARLIHKRSARSGAAFRAMNCAAIADVNLESELFGVAEKAFTEVVKRKGVFRSADGGTLFMDEIGDLSPAAQAKVLRAIEYQEFTPAGSDKVVQTDIRLVYGTNRDLKQLVDDGLFRRDLYDRVSNFKIKVPPLCERTGDILPLIEHFCVKFGLMSEDQEIPLTESAEQILLNYSWVGNVRELEGFIQTCSIRCKGRLIGFGDISEEIVRDAQERIATNSKLVGEKERLRQMLKANGGNVSQLARVLGVKVSTLHAKLKRLGLI